MYFTQPGLRPFLLYRVIEQVVDFTELLLSNFSGQNNSIVVEQVNGKHLSLLQVLMCL
jgi:hypothetical protein